MKISGSHPVPVISIIVPAFEEPDLQTIWDAFSGLDAVEVIFALAEGDDSTTAPPGACAIRAAKGRAAQMNAGAAAATGDILLFLHADTWIPPGSLDAARQALARPGVAAGAYSLRVDGEGPWFRFISSVANVRSRALSMPFGDQAIFISRGLFLKLGGYDPVPILEDVELARKAKRNGRIVILQETAVTSCRRWMARGRYMTTIRNWWIMAAYTLGAPPRAIARWFAR